MNSESSQNQLYDRVIVKSNALIDNKCSSSVNSLPEDELVEIENKRVARVIETDSAAGCLICSIR